MSEENVKRIRAGIEAMNRHDIDAVVLGMDPEVRFEHRLAALQGSFVGVEGVRRWFADLVEHFDTWRIYCQDIRDLDDRRGVPPERRACRAAGKSCTAVFGPHGFPF